MTDRAGVLARLTVSRETAERLDAYAAVLTRWNDTINLVARATLPDLWTRHIEDSAQLWPLAPERTRTWLDFGSGAGLPGLVIAAVAAEKRPTLSMTLVESDTRKAVFLRDAARQMGLTVSVLDVRVETLTRGPFDVISARAVAPLARLLDYASPLLAPDGVCLFPKGANVASELTAAQRRWHIQWQAHRSVTDPAAHILEIKEPVRAVAPNA